MTTPTNIKKRLLAALVGIEVGLLLVGLTFMTLIGYVISGLLSYVISLILPIDQTILQNTIGIIISIILVSVATFYCVLLSDRLYSYFKWIAFGIPIICGLSYYILFLPTDKQSKVNDELKQYNVENKKISESDKLIILDLENKLTKLSNELDWNSNLHLGIFSTNSNRVDSIIVDRIFLSHLDSLGMCVYTSKNQNMYHSSTLFFNPTNLTIYSGHNVASGYGNDRQAALLELYYQLYVSDKTRKKATYSPSYKTWTETVPSILDSNYWSTTVREDTINMTIYGKI